MLGTAIRFCSTSTLAEQANGAKGAGSEKLYVSFAPGIVADKERALKGDAESTRV